MFDFAMLAISTAGYTSGFSVSGSFLHIKGIEVKNVPMNTRSNRGMGASGSNNIFELIEFDHNNGTGLFINGGMGGNLIVDCDSHDNYDPTSSQGDGQDADGFGVHYQTTGATTTVRGCRAWWNSDDGSDTDTTGSRGPDARVRARRRLVLMNDGQPIGTVLRPF